MLLGMSTMSVSHLQKLYLGALIMFGVASAYFAVATVQANFFGMSFSSSALTDSTLASLSGIQLSLVILFILPSIALLVLTYFELYRPVQKTQMSKRLARWNLALAVCGVFYGLIIGGVILASAYGKVKKEMEKS